MKIEAVDFFYLSMPQVEDIGDGSQDALLVRVAAGGYVGWGECEAAPLVTIAAMICPMSHSACKPVLASVLGASLDSPADIARIHADVHQNSMDLLQADHALSGIDIALWDLLGHRYQEPVWKLLGYERAYPKTPYASMLFGDTPQETCDKVRATRERGFRVVKLGWGPYGKTTPEADRDQVLAAREGLGADGLLCVDAGTVWADDLALGEARLAALREANVYWLEEPFHTGALHVYKALATLSAPIYIAGGEGAHNEHMARHMIDYAGVGYVQIDTGRIGGITVAKRVTDYAVQRGARYINHTFTSHLALSASLQPYAGVREHHLCEYPVELKSLAYDLTSEHLLPDANGDIQTPDQPGLGIAPDVAALRNYLVDAEIVVNGQTLYKTPAL
ncbi:MAG: mandelate racemase/muconate lactonizing enzyme family protein [Chloroflexi bacterium]|uniref:mandelate racemase/muconate lactonizing enzyme family protein n=1 Tax=Candidatus Flexifilum breve TaxID=3140694 RepID=UPI00313611F0|nr:mandelate racemase/muconate lactonizing enzyme family protein [Chloroflexota bacterium]